MNLVVLVLDSFTQNSIRNSKIQKSTWVKDFSNHSEVLFYKGGSETFKSGHDLLLNCSDTYSDMGIKTLKAFEWVDSNLSYDYIFRTNTSSYVNCKNLIHYLKKIREEGSDYCGYIGNYDGIEYVSGSGIILSEHAIKSIIRYKSELDTDIVEDVAFGKLLKLNDILPIKGKRKDIESHKDIRNIVENFYKEEKLNKHCIYGGIRNNFEKSCELMNYVEPSHHYQYNNILNDCHDFYYNFKTPPSILGCFQLYKKKNIFYQNSHDNFLNGADFDYSFGYKNFDLFCNMENLNYYHLGYGGENWKGKTVEFEDDFMIKLEHIYFNCNVKCNNFYYNSKKTLLGINKKANHKNLDIYDDVYTNSFEFRDDINNFFKDEKSYKIAEIGCYRGYTTRFLSNCFEKVYAVDNSVEYINFNINYNRDKSKNIEFIQLEKKNYWENLPDVDVILFNFYNNFEYYKPDLINLIKYTPKLKYIIFNDYGVVKEVSKLVDSALTDHILEFKKYIGLNNVSNYDYDIVKNTSEGIICKVVKQHNDIIGKNYKWNNLKLSFLEDGKLNPFENGKYINIDKYLLRCEFNNEVYLFKFSKDFSKFISVKKGNLDLLSGILITEPVMKKKNKNVEGVGFGFGFGEC